MNKKRIYYSKDFKRQALIEVANGKNFKDVLRAYGVDIDAAIKKDKKYCEKLIHKWKREVYENNELLYFVNNEISSKNLNIEIEFLNDDQDESDIIIDEVKSKIFQAKSRYKKLKSRIISTYLKKI